MISQENSQQRGTPLLRQAGPARNPPRGRQGRRGIDGHGLAGGQRQAGCPDRRRNPPARPGGDRRPRLPAERDGQDARQRQLQVHRAGRRRDRHHTLRRPDHPRCAGRGVEARLRPSRRQHRRQRRARAGRDRDDARTQGTRHPLLHLVPPADRGAGRTARDRLRPRQLLLPRPGTPAPSCPTRCRAVAPRRRSC